MANNIITNIFKNEFMKGNIDPVNDTFYIALVTSACDEVADNTKRLWNTFSANVQAVGYEVSGTGYSAGGIALTNVAVVSGGTPAGFVQYLSATDAQWSGVTLTNVCGTVAYKTAGAAGLLNIPVCYLSFNAAKQSENGSFSLFWNTTYGIISLT